MSSAAEKASACHSPEAEDAPRQAGREAATERQAVQCPMPDLVPQSESPGTSLARFQVFTTPLVQHHVPPFRDEPAENLLAVFLTQQVQLEVVQETLDVEARFEVIVLPHLRCQVFDLRRGDVRQGSGSLILSCR